MDTVYGSIINDTIKPFKLTRFNFLFWFGSSYLHFIDTMAIYFHFFWTSIGKQLANCTESMSGFSFIMKSKISALCFF